MGYWGNSLLSFLSGDLGRPRSKKPALRGDFVCGEALLALVTRAVSCVFPGCCSRLLSSRPTGVLLALFLSITGLQAAFASTGQFSTDSILGGLPLSEKQPEPIGVGLGVGHPETATHTRVSPVAQSLGSPGFQAHGLKLPKLPGDENETTAGGGQDLHTRLGGFTEQGNSALRLGQGRLWLNDTSQGTQGVGVRVIPISRDPQRLAIEGTYLDREVGAGNASPVISHDNVWSLAVNSRWLDERLTLHGEYAQSRKDHSAWGSLLDPHSDQAYTMLASYSDQTQLPTSHPLVWGLSLGWQQAGRTFWSPAANKVSRDEAIKRAVASLRWGAFDTRLRVARAMDNVADDPAVPTWQKNILAADLHYTSRQAGLPAGLGWLFAKASYALSLKHERSSLVQAPEGDTTDHDHSTDTASLTARFEPGRWWWKVSYTHSMLHVSGSEKPDRNSNSTQLNLHLPLCDWLYLTPELQWSLSEGLGPDNETRTLAGKIGGSASLIPDRLAAKMNLQAVHHYRSELGRNDQAMGVESSLDWTLQSGHGDQPNVTISLRGSYRYADNTDSSGGGAVQYQAFSGVRISWPHTN